MKFLSPNLREKREKDDDEDNDDDNDDDVEEANTNETHSMQRLDDTTLAEISRLDPRDVLIHQAGYDDITDTSDHGFTHNINCTTTHNFYSIELLDHVKT